MGRDRTGQDHSTGWDKPILWVVGLFKGSINRPTPTSPWFGPTYLLILLQLQFSSIGSIFHTPPTLVSKTTKVREIRTQDSCTTSWPAQDAVAWYPPPRTRGDNRHRKPSEPTVRTRITSISMASALHIRPISPGVDF